MEEWIKEQQRRYLDEPRLKELTEVMKQIRKFVREKEYRKLTELVRRYRKAGGGGTPGDYPSCLPVVKLAPVPDTGKNGGNGQVRIDDGIEKHVFHGEERLPACGCQSRKSRFRPRNARHAHVHAGCLLEGIS